jgi:hypothetical protein
MTDDKDIEVQLEGLFADSTLNLDQLPEEDDLLIEEKIIALLGNEPARIEDEAELATDELAMLEIPSLMPAVRLAEAQEEIKAEEREPRATDSSAWESRLQEQRTKILNVMLSILAGVATVIIALQLVNVVRDPGQWLVVYIPYFVAYAVLMVVATIRRINSTIRVAVLAALAYGVGISALLNEGPLSAGGLYLLAAPLLLSILVKQRAGTIASVASGLIYTGFLLADHLGWLHPSAPYRPDVRTVDVQPCTD